MGMILICTANNFAPLNLYKMKMNTQTISKGKSLFLAAFTAATIFLISCSGSLPVEWKNLSLQKDGVTYFYKDKPFTGKTFQNYSNGKKKFEVDYVDGKENGKYLSWFENGTKEYEGSTLNGEANGKCTYWNENGTLASEITYSNGLKEGSAIYYDENGKKDIEETYHADNLLGKYIYYYPNGKKKEEGSHIYNPETKITHQDGLTTRWREDGTKESEDTYKDGKPDGYYAWYHENGQMSEKGMYVNGKVTAQEYFDETGKKLE